MHEIITLQLGQRSNYLATHFWNTQESYFTYSADHEPIVDHDLHFRPGIGADGTETFTPRTVIYDLKGGFGSLRKINALYEIEEPIASQEVWNGPAIAQRQSEIQQNAYQQSLEAGSEPPQLTTETVRYWSDFNRVYYHPKSIVQLNDYDLNSSLMPFENWDAGEELFHSLDKEHDVLDRDLRPFVEEADQMQGIQIMGTTDDAWGGFAAQYLDRLRDEFGKTSIWFWGSEDNMDSIPRAKRVLKLSNIARSTSEISPQSSAFIPITLPSLPLPDYTEIFPRSHWQISGLLSTALESVTLASRLHLHHSSHQTLDGILNSLNINGNQNIMRIRMSINQPSEVNGNEGFRRPATHRQGEGLRNSSQERHDEGLQIENGHDLSMFDMDFFPAEMSEQSRRTQVTRSTHVFGQFESYRTGNQINKKGSEEDDKGDNRARKVAGQSTLKSTSISLPFPLLDSFPQIYFRSSNPSSLDINTSLSTDTAVSLKLKRLQQVVSRAVGVDEREALSNSLGQLTEAYEEGWQSGSDGDDD